MKFWRNKKTAAAKDLKSKAASESREYVAESLEARILYSGAPMDTAVPDTSGDTTAESQSSTRFSSIDDFESAGESAIPKRMSSESSEEVILSNFENLSPLEITELAQVAIEQWKSTDLSEHQFEVINQLEASLVEIESLSGPANWESDQQSSGTFDYGRTTSIIPEPSVQHGVELISDLLQEISDPITLERLAIEQIASRTVATNLPLTYNTLDFIADAAERTWTSTGLTADQIAALGSIEYHIADLDGARLGYAEGSHIYIDRDAAGLGWFIDSTPDQDEEFAISGSSTFTSATDPTSVAYDNVDLLSVILHEQGHVLGLDHDEDPDSLMDDTIGKGERHRPDSDAAIGATPGSLEGIHYVLAPIANNDGGGPFTVSEDEILETTPQIAYEDSVNSSDPLIYWQFGETDRDDGSPVINSAVGSSSLSTAGNGTYLATVDLASDPPIPGGNAITVHGNLKEGIGRSFTGNFPSTTSTFEGWFRAALPSASDQPALFSYEGTGGQGNEFIALFNSGSNLAIYANGTQINTALSRSDIFDNTWHHLAITLDSTTGSGVGTTNIYLDGQLKDSKTSTALATPLSSSGQLVVGWEQDGALNNGNQAYQGYRGDIAEIAIYGSVLSAAEISSHYNTTISTNLLDNDTDTDGDTLAIDVSGGAVITSIRGATVTLQSNGEFRYDPTSAAELQGLLNGQSITDTFTYTTTDGALSDTATVTVTVTGANDAPTLANKSTVTFIEGESGVLVAPNLTLSDPDLNSTADGNSQAGGDPGSYSASAEITSGFDDGQDSLSLSGALSPNIDFVVSGNGRRIDFTALNSDATIGDFQTALRLVTFENTSEFPDPGINRLVAFNFNDGMADAIAGPRDIAIFDFNDGNTTVDFSPTNLTVSNITLGAGADLDGVTRPTTPAPGYANNILRVSPKANMTNISSPGDLALEEAIIKDIYFEFTIGANAETYSLSTLALDLSRGASSGIRGYAIRSSVDNYTADLAREDNVNSANFSRPNLKNIPIDLTDADAFNQLTSDVTFRVYFHTPTTGNEMDIDNIIVTGTVASDSTVPNPSTVTLIPVNDPVTAISDGASGEFVVTENDIINFVTGNLTTNDNDLDIDGSLPDDTLTVIGLTNTESTYSQVNASDHLTIKGVYGSIEIEPSGAFSYSLDNADPDTDALSSGDIAQESFVYTVSDRAPIALATYAFNGGSGEVTNVDSSITAGNVTPRGASGMAGISGPNQNSYLNGAATEDNLAGALDDAEYFDFTISPADGQPLTLTSLDFDLGGSNGVFNNAVIFQSSIGGFGSGNPVLHPEYAFTSTVNNNPSTGPYPTQTLVLGPEFQNLTTPVTFRYTFIDNTNKDGSYNRIDNIVVNGLPADATIDTATVTLTVSGASDAPVAVNDNHSSTESGGSNNTTPGVIATGNVITGVEALQQQQASLLHQYTFSGTDPLSDKQGSADLRLVANGSATVSLNQEKAVFEGNDDGDNESYLESTSNLDIPLDDMTLEFIFTPTVDSGQNQAHIISSIGTDGRFYLAQYDNEIRLAVGDSSTFHTVVDAARFKLGTPTYVALRFDYYETTVPGGSGPGWLVDAFIGDTATGSLEQVWDQHLYDTGDSSYSNWDRTWRFGRNSANGATRWQGELDSVAFYDDRLTDNTIQAHFSNAPGDSDIDSADTVSTGTETDLQVSNIAFNSTAFDGVSNESLAVSGPTQINGAYGTLTIQPDGSYSYTPNEGVMAGIDAGTNPEDIFTYTVSDSEGATDTATLTVTINGATDVTTLVYVNDDWAGLTVGDSIADADLETAAAEAGVFEADAFATLAEALAALDTTQPVTLVVNAGDYSTEDLDLSGFSNQVTVKFVEGNSTIGSLTGGTNIAIHLDDDVNHSVATVVTINQTDDTTFSGTLAGNGGITKIGNGTLTLSGDSANTYTGLTTINAGFLVLDKDSAGIQAIGGDVSISNGSLRWDEAHQINDAATITQSGGSVLFNRNSETLSNLSRSNGSVATGGSSAIINILGTLNLSGSGSFSINSPSTVFAETMTMTGGSLAIGVGGGILHIGSGGLTMQGTTIDMNGGSSQLILDGDLTVLSSSNPARIRLSSGTFSSGGVDLGGVERTFNVADGDATLDLIIDAPIKNGALRKAGDGTLQLTGTSLYAGGTNIEAGTLDVDGSIRGASVNVENGATLTGSGTIDSAINGAIGSLIHPDGDLLLGDGSTAGFVTLGTLQVDSGDRLTILDSDQAELGVTSSIAGELKVLKPGAASDLSVDFGRNTGGDDPLQAGFEGFSQVGDANPANKTVTYPNDTLSGTGNSVSVSVLNAQYYRDDSAITSGSFVSQSDLLSDSILSNGSGVVTLRLEDLLDGDYEITTYHHTSRSFTSPGIFSLSVSDGIAADQIVGTGLTQSSEPTAPTSILTQTFRFAVVNGSPVEIKYQKTGGQYVSLNGFELSKIPLGTVAVSSGSLLTVDGRVEAGSVALASGSTLTGSGKVDASIDGAAGSFIISDGHLSLGDGSTTGFDTEGTFIVGQGDNVTIHDSDGSLFGENTIIDGFLRGSTAALSVDFGRDHSGDDPLQTGFEGFNRFGDGNATHSQSYANDEVAGVGNSVNVTIINPTHYRDYSTISSGDFVGLNNLLADSVLRNTAGTMTLRLDNLLDGEYEITTYHHSTGDFESGKGGVFNLSVTDGVENDRIIGTGLTESFDPRNPASILTQTFRFTVVAGSSVDIMLEQTGGGHVNLNGFELFTLPQASVAIGAGDKLSGSGNIQMNTASSGSTILPGSDNGSDYTGSGTTGFLTTQDLTLDTSTTLSVDLNSGGVEPTDHDRLDVTGNLEIGGARLDVHLGYTPSVSPPADSFTIVKSSSAVTGLFKDDQGDDLADGATFESNGARYTINYTATEVSLTVAAPTTVYVDDSFTTDGTEVDGDIETTDNEPAIIGYNAFSTINAALAAIDQNLGGTIVVNAGDYSSETVDLTTPGTDLDITLQFVENSSTVGSLATGSGDQIVLGGFDGSHSTPVTLTLGGNGSSTTIAGIISGTGGLTKIGNGSLTLSGSNTYEGATLIDDGTVTISNDNALGTPGGGTSINQVNDARLQLSGNITIAEEITLTGRSPGLGTTLRNSSGNNTISGEVILEGDIRIQSGSGSLTFSGGVTGTTNTFLVINSSGGSIHFTTKPIDINGGTFHVDSGGLTTLEVSGNTWSRTRFTSGTLRLNAVDALPPTADLFVGGVSYGPNGTLDLNGYSQTVASLSRMGATAATTAVQITSATAATLTVNQTSNTQYDGGFTGALSLVKNNSGSLTITGAYAPTDNHHTGDTIVNGGTLALGNTGILRNSTLDTGLTGSQQVTFTVAGDQTYDIGGLTGADDLAMGTNSIRVGANGLSTTFDGVLSGGGSLTKAGIGSLTLSSANTYTGGTTIDSGALILTNISGSATGGGAITLNNALLGGTGSFSGPVTSIGGTISAGLTSGDTTDDLDSGNLTLDSNSTVQIELGGTTPGDNYDQVIVNGSVNLNSDGNTEGGALLNLSLVSAFTPLPADTFRLIDNDSTDSLSGTTFRYNNGVEIIELTEGSVFTVDDQVFTISYIGGDDANDVVITAHGTVETTVTVLGTNLVITDINGAADSDDQLTLTVTDTGYLITSNQLLDAAVEGATRPSPYELFIPFDALTAAGIDQIDFDTKGGVDVLTLDFGQITDPANRNGASLQQKIVFLGGDGIGDELRISNGVFTRVLHAMTDGSSGVLDLDDDINSDIEVEYSGLEPVDMSGSTATDFVFNLPAGVDNAQLSQDSGTGFITLASTDGTPTFESTTFAPPSGSITINGAAEDNVTVSSDLTLTGPLTINAGTINLNGDLLTGTGGTSGDVIFNGDLFLETDLRIDTSGAALATDPATSSGTLSITGTLTGNDHDLAIRLGVGTGTVAGNASGIDQFTVEQSGVIDFQAGLSVDSALIATEGRDATVEVTGGDVSVGNGDTDDTLIIGFRSLELNSHTIGIFDTSQADNFSTNLRLVKIAMLTHDRGIGNITGTLRLSDNSTVKATEVILGEIEGANVRTITGNLELGASNDFDVDTFVVGGHKSRGNVSFITTGTLDLAGLSGSKTDLRVGDNSDSNTSATNIGSMDLSNGIFTAALGELVIGDYASDQAGSGSGRGSAFGTLTLSQDSLNNVTSDSILLGNYTKDGSNDASGTYTKTASGTLVMGGGSFTVAGDVVRGENAGASSPNPNFITKSISSLLIEGGTFTVGGNLAVDNVTVGLNSKDALLTVNGTTAQIGAGAGTELNIGVRNSNTNTADFTGTLDLSAVTTVSIDVDSVIIGEATSSNDGFRTEGILKLGDINTILGDVTVGGTRGTGSVEIEDNGTLEIGSPTSRSHLRIGYNNALTGNHAVGTIDLSNAASFTATLDELILGERLTAAGGSNGTAKGDLHLAATNTVDSTVVLVSQSEMYINQPKSTLTLGASNTFKADTFTVGGNRANALVEFAAPGGVFNLSGSSVSETDLIVGKVILATGNPTTGILDLSGGTFNATLDEFDIAYKSWRDDQSPTAIGTVSFDSGTVTANSVVIGEGQYRVITSDPLRESDGRGIGTLNISGDAVFEALAIELGIGTSTGSVGTINQDGGIVRIGTISEGVGTAVYNWSGGTIQHLAGQDLTIPEEIPINIIGTSDQTFDIESTQTITVNSVLSGTGGFSKIDTGTLALTAANTYEGSTDITAGKVIVDGSGASISNTESITIDAGALQIINGATVSVDNGVTNGAGSGSLQVDNGTMTVIAGGLSVDNARVGYDGSGTLTVQAGDVTIGDGDGTNFDIGRRTTTNAVGTVNLDGASSVTIDVDNVRIGSDPSNGGSGKGIVTLSTLGDNLVTADSVIIGHTLSGGNQTSATTSELHLGGAANTFQVDTFTVGDLKSSGKVDIVSGGTFTLGGDGNAATDLRIGFNNTAGTGTAPVLSTLDLTGGTFNATLDDVFIGAHASGNGGGKGALIYDAGTITADRIFLADTDISGSSANNSNTTGALTQNGGFLTVGILDLADGVSTFNLVDGTVKVTTALNLADTDGNSTLNLSGGTLDLSGVDIVDRPGAETFTFTGGTLKDVNDFGVSLTQGGGILQVGADGEADRMSVDGDYTQNSGAIEISINGTAGPGVVSGHDQITIDDDATDSTVTLSGMLNLDLNYAAVSGDTFTILVNDEAGDAIVGTFSGMPEGHVFEVDYAGTSYTFTISYTGGDGNDVVLTAAGVAETEVSLDASGNLVITDIAGGTSADDLTIYADQANSRYVISDSSLAITTTPTGGRTLAPNAVRFDANTVYIPFSDVTGSLLIINTLDGADSVTLDSVQDFVDGIDYQAGDPAAGDTLTITNSVFTNSLTHNHLGSDSGTLDINNDSVDDLSYSGLDGGIDMTGSTLTDLVFNLPTGTDGAQISQAGGNLILESLTGTFQSTSFALPSGSITINGDSSDSVVIASDLNLDGAITFNLGLVKLDHNITANGPVDFNSVVRLGSTVTVDTSAGGGSDIAFQGMVSGDVAGRGLQLNAGTAGNITFDDAITAGVVVGEAENYTRRTSAADGTEWKVVPGERLPTDNAIDIVNARGGEFVQLLADGSGSAGGPNNAPSIEYEMNITRAGTYRLYMRWDGDTPAGSADSMFVDILELKDGTGGQLADHYELQHGIDHDFATTPWDGSGGFEVNNASGTPKVPAVWEITEADIAANNGVFTLRFSEREDGAAVDAFVFQLSSFAAPTDIGPAELEGGSRLGTLKVIQSNTVTFNSIVDVETLDIEESAAEVRDIVTVDNIELSEAGTSASLSVTNGNLVTVVNGITDNGGTSSLQIDNGTMSVGNGLTVDNLRVGYNSGTGDLTVNSGAVLIGSGSETLDLGRRDAGNGNTMGTVDFSGASSVTIDVSQVRQGTGTTGSGWTQGDMTLSQTGTNTITATSLTLSEDSPAQNQSISTSSDLHLGGGTNTFNINTMSVGGLKGVGMLDIAAGGTLTLSGKTVAETDLRIGYNRAGTGSAPAESVMDLTGGTFNATLDDLIIGLHGSLSGAGRGKLIFEAGTVSANNILLADPSASGTSTNPANTTGKIDLNGGTLQFRNLSNGGGTSTFNWNAGTIQNLSGQDLTIQTNLPITINGDNGQTFDIESGRTASVNNVFSGAGGVSKLGNGTLILNGNNTYSGATGVSAGTMLINGNHTGGENYTIAAGATLGGNGSITPSAGQTVTIEGVLATGDPASSGGIGNLTVNSDITINRDFQFQIDGGTSDTLVSSVPASQVTLGAAATLTVSDATEPAAGSSILVINNEGADPVNGTFAGLQEGATVFDDDGNRYTISYVGGDGNDVVLYAGEAQTNVDLSGGILSITDITSDSNDTLLITYNSDDNTYTIRETANSALVINTTGLLPHQISRPNAQTVVVDGSLVTGLTIDTTGADSEVEPGDKVTIETTNGPITLNGNLLVIADEVMVNPGVTINTTGTIDITANSGDLNLETVDLTADATINLIAGDNFKLHADASIVSNNGQINITVDQTGVDDPEGSSVEILGTVNAFGNVFISGGNDRDQFNIVPSVFSVINIDGKSPTLVDDGDILNTLNAINPQRTVVVDGFSGTFSFGGGQKAINYTDIERDNVPSLEIDIPISQRLFPTTVNGSFTDFGLIDSHVLEVDWKDPDGGVSTFTIPSFNGGLAPGMIIASSTDGMQLQITGMDPTTGEVEFTVSHIYQKDGLYQIDVAVTDSTDAKAEASAVAEVYFLAPDSNGTGGFFSFAALPGRFTLTGISGLFQDYRFERLFVTDGSGHSITDLPGSDEPLQAGVFISLEGDVRIVYLTGPESEPTDVLSALNNSILNGTPLDLSGNALLPENLRVLEMVSNLIDIDVTGGNQ
ncbi:MAG: autotransporter-associated beta strand repeat-containing protein [Verrucomicrobiales bacterium]|nr:autotransporter-associated beta strand repeat-containing protein [Verrucomicrobiales bacterium]